MAAYTGVESAAAKVFDRDDVEWGRPVGALRQWRDREPEDRGSIRIFRVLYAHDGGKFVKDVLLLQRLLHQEVGD